MNFDFNDWRADLLSRVDRGLKYGKSIGAKSIEIYIIKKQNLKISIQTGIINGVQGGSFGVGCRCAINKKIGFAAASGITDQAVNFAVKSALDSAKINQEDNRWGNFVQNNKELLTLVNYRERSFSYGLKRLTLRTFTFFREAVL